MRQALWSRKTGWKKEFEEESQYLHATLGIEPDYDILEMPVENKAIPYYSQPAIAMNSRLGCCSAVNAHFEGAS